MGQMEKNIIYNSDCRNLDAYIDDESVDLVIADPPYFKVSKQKWDYLWRTEKDYVEWSKQWLIKVSRALRKGGTLYIFGFFRTLAYLLPEIERLGFKFKQQIIIDKGIQAVSGRATKNYKMFPNTTESILMFYKDSRPFIREMLKERQKALGLSAKDINERLGVKSNGGGMWSIYTGENVCEQIPTKELWESLQNILQFQYPYEELSQTYNVILGMNDVWCDLKFYNNKERIHPTQKPFELMERLILASSNEGDLVLDPFMGSGCTACMCKKNRRDYVGFEIDAEYYKKSLELIDRF